MSTSAAGRARTAVAQASVGTLTTTSGAHPRCTVVDVTETTAGLVLWIREDSAAVADLVDRPVATVQVASPGFATVALRGEASRSDRHDPAGRLGYLLEPAAVWLPPAGGPVDVDEFLRAEPDPLHELGPALLAHLRQAHGADLAACLRARGCRAEWVDPTALDRWGLSVAVLGPDGVHAQRLDFPHPVRRIVELPVSLRAALFCRCCVREGT